MFRPLTLAVLAIGSLAAADTWEIDAAHSYALFKVKHLGTSHNYGTFPGIAGTVTTDADVSKNTVSITIDPASVATANAKRDEHLRGPDFLDAKQFKTASFTGTGWKAVGEGKWEVAGTLTLHGVAKSLTVVVAQTGSGTNPFTNKLIIGYETVFTIKQSDFGMNWAKDKGALSDEVQLTVAIEAQKK